MEEREKCAKKRKKREFHKRTDEEKKDIWDQRKAESTNKATKLWIACFNDYLEQNNLPTADEISKLELADTLPDFYTELKKSDNDGDYKLTTLKAIRAAINRYYKDKRCLDIINDVAFVRANEMFKGVARKAKREGCGEIDSKPPIEPEDMDKIAQYFKQCLEGPPNPAKLRQIVLFNIIYYMGRRGRQNLRPMTKDTFAIGCDPDGQRFIYQAVKEQDKNHTEADLNPSNEARIYAIPGECKFLTCYTIFPFCATHEIFAMVIP